MITLWIFAALALLASLVADRPKTLRGMVKGARMFGRMAPTLAGVLAVMSVLLAVMTPATLQRLLAGAGWASWATALAVGAVARIPGFVAFPAAGLARQQGASVGLLAAFVTSLMMVGVLTLPIEAGTWAGARRCCATRSPSSARR